jgi:hypothetical protein
MTRKRKATDRINVAIAAFETIVSVAESEPLTKATVAMLQEQCREARSALIEIQTVIRASLERL